MKSLYLVTKNERIVDHVATGKRMRDARTKYEVSLREVARRMGFSAPYVSDLELGRRAWSERTAELYWNALIQKGGAK